MRIDIPKVDARSQSYVTLAITDLDNGKHVGELWVTQSSFTAGKYYPRRTVSLFDGKYIGNFDTHEECAAFAAGVSAVLNHIVKIDPEEPRHSKNAA